METTAAKKRIPKIILLLTTIIWGSTFFIIKNTLDEVPPYFLLAVRFFFSAVILGALCGKKWKLFNKNYAVQGGLTGVFLALAYIFQTLGLQNTAPGTNAFLTTVYCILVPFVFWAWGGRKPGAYNLVAAAVCVAGIGLVCLDGGGVKFDFRGEGYTLICGVFFALQIVAVGIYGDKLDLMLYTAIQFFTAFLICGFMSLLTEQIPESLTPAGAGSLAYITVMATCLCFVMMNYGIKRTRPAPAALILSLEAVFGVIFSMAFYRERPGVQTWIGFALIFAAITVGEVMPHIKPKRKPDEDVNS